MTLLSFYLLIVLEWNKKFPFSTLKFAQVLKDAGQDVPKEMMSFDLNIKKKEHKLYGSFGPKDYGLPMKKATKIVFDDWVMNVRCTALKLCFAYIHCMYVQMWVGTYFAF